MMCCRVLVCVVHVDCSHVSFLILREIGEGSKVKAYSSYSDVVEVAEAQPYPRLGPSPLIGGR